MTRRQSWWKEHLFKKERATPQHVPQLNPALTTTPYYQNPSRQEQLLHMRKLYYNSSSLQQITPFTSSHQSPSLQPHSHLPHFAARITPQSSSNSYEYQQYQHPTPPHPRHHRTRTNSPQNLSVTIGVLQRYPPGETYVGRQIFHW